LGKPSSGLGVISGAPAEPVPLGTAGPESVGAVEPETGLSLGRGGPEDPDGPVADTLALADGATTPEEASEGSGVPPEL
jgi:hypothetical protein